MFRQVALAPEPVLHGATQTLQGHARADLHPAIAGGDGVVEDLVVGEIAHAEAIQPLHWAGQPLSSILVLYLYLAREHA